MKNDYHLLKAYCDTHSATLVAVSKTKPLEDILDLYHLGQRIFGENKVQELVDKSLSLPSDIEWHMIGHLQTNKVKMLLPHVVMIHSCDRHSLISELHKHASILNKKIDVLLQIKIAEEDSKYGWDWDDLITFLQSSDIYEYDHINYRGVMGMATFTDDDAQISQEFRLLKSYFDQLKTTYFDQKTSFDTISMGMSGDYKLAVSEGSNMIRIGSLLFGGR